jgi:hypothetical protein
MQSQATAIVTAKLKNIQQETNVSWQLIREAARATAKKTVGGNFLAGQAWDMYRGFGIIQVADAIQYIKDNYTENAEFKADLADKLEAENQKYSMLEFNDLGDLTPVPKKFIESLIRYDDIQPSAEFTPAVGGTAPDVVTHSIGGVGVNLRSFDGNNTEEAMTANFEILHGVDIDSLNRSSEPLLAEIHTHGMPSTNAAGVVKIFFDLVYQPANAAPIAWGTVSTLITISANQQYFHKIQGVELTKPSSGYNIGDMILVKYRRTPSDTEDTYADDWLFKQCAMHLPFNTIGSRTRYIK